MNDIRWLITLYSLRLLLGSILTLVGWFYAWFVSRAIAYKLLRRFAASGCGETPPTQVRAIPTYRAE